MYYFKCLVDNHGLRSARTDRTYKYKSLSESVELDNYRSVLEIFAIQTEDSDLKVC